MNIGIFTFYKNRPDRVLNQAEHYLLAQNIAFRTGCALLLVTINRIITIMRFEFADEIWSTIGVAVLLLAMLSVEMLLGGCLSKFILQRICPGYSLKQVNALEDLREDTKSGARQVLEGLLAIVGFVVVWRFEQSEDLFSIACLGIFGMNCLLALIAVGNALSDVCFAITDFWPIMKASFAAYITASTHDFSEASGSEETGSAEAEAETETESETKEEAKPGTAESAKATAEAAASGDDYNL